MVHGVLTIGVLLVLTNLADIILCMHAHMIHSLVHCYSTGCDSSMEAENQLIITHAVCGFH